MLKKYTQNLYIYGLSLFRNPKSMNVQLYFMSKVYLWSQCSCTAGSQFPRVAKSGSYASVLNSDFRWRQRNSSPPFQQVDVKSAFYCETLQTHHSAQWGSDIRGQQEDTELMACLTVKEISQSWHILIREATVPTVSNRCFWLISRSLKDWWSVRINY